MSNSENLHEMFDKCFEQQLTEVFNNLQHLEQNGNRSCSCRSRVPLFSQSFSLQEDASRSRQALSDEALSDDCCDLRRYSRERIAQTRNGIESGPPGQTVSKQPDARHRSKAVSRDEPLQSRFPRETTSDQSLAGNRTKAASYDKPFQSILPRKTASK